MNINLISKSQSFTGERFILTHAGWEQIDNELFDFLQSSKYGHTDVVDENAIEMSHNDFEGEKTAITGFW